MAKLSARGRHELARVSKERSICYKSYGTRQSTFDPSVTFETRCSLLSGHDGDCDGDGQTDWERRTLALMSDGRILEKLDVRFGPDTATARYGQQRHSYGWKQYRKFKPGKTLDQMRESFLAMTAKKGWEQNGS